VSTPILELDGVGKSYATTSRCAAQGERHAIADVSLGVAQGELVAIIGGSGCGKTTTLKCINGLVRPDRGEIRVAGRAIVDIEGHVLRRSIGYVFQGVGLFPHMVVADNIGITPQLLGWTAGDIAARVAELLELVGLPPELARRSPAELSGGQRQRVGLARALAARPKIMLMDEPFGALDPLTRAALGRDYLALHREMGLSTVMVTHDILEAVLLADRIVVMREGRIVADDTPRALLHDHADPEVARLMDMPRQQAARVSAMLEVAP
jgi:osmoprotectant transport system ATP-binding protein